MEKLYALLLKGKPFYFKGALSDVLFKWVNGKGYTVKFNTGEEKEALVTKNANLADSLLQLELTTKEEYDGFGE